MKHNKNINRSHQIPEHVLPHEVVSSLRRMVEAERERSMMSMPSERVMRAVRAAASAYKESFLERELVSWFRPVMALGVIIILALAAYNFDLSRNNDHNQTATEMVLGLHPVTVAAAYDIEFDHHD